MLLAKQQDTKSFKQCSLLQSRKSRRKASVRIGKVPGVVVATKECMKERAIEVRLRRRMSMHDM
jgi:hypothetical protein